jgi:hypothetical protein
LYLESENFITRNNGWEIVMIKFNYRERAAHCARWHSESASEQAKEIWRRMQEHWQQRAAKELEPKNIRASFPAKELFRNLSGITRILRSGDPTRQARSRSFAAIPGAHPEEMPAREDRPAAAEAGPPAEITGPMVE